MNLYCSYLGPFVELKEPKIIKKTLSESALVCRNKGCSTFGQFKQLYAGNYCSTCGVKQSKEKIVMETVPTKELLSYENKEMVNFDVLNSYSAGKKNYFLVIDCRDDNGKYSGKYYQTNQISIVDNALIEVQKNEFNSKFECVKQTLNNNFESVSDVQYGWIKFETEDEDYTNCNC